MCKELVADSMRARLNYDIDTFSGHHLLRNTRNKAMKLHQLNDSLFRCDLLGLLLNDMAGGDGCGLFGWVRATDHPSIFN